MLTETAPLHYDLPYPQRLAAAALALLDPNYCGKNMKLSRLERLLLSNQYLILESLNPKEAKFFAERREALEGGFESHYGWMLDRIEEEVMAEEESREVLEILDMHTALLRAPDKGDGYEPWQIAFSGFDANHEGKQMSYARYFCNLDGGRYTELIQVGKDEFNSHFPCLDRYRRQLVAWHASADRHFLTKQDVERIAREGKHPDRR